MSQPTRAMILSPLHYAWCLDKLLQQGHDRATAEHALRDGEWASLPVTQWELDRYTCKSCGKKPYKDSGGRFHLGCAGTCQQRAFADMRDESVQERARKASLAAVREPEKPSVERKQRGLWMDTD